VKEFRSKDPSKCCREHGKQQQEQNNSFLGLFIILLGPQVSDSERKENRTPKQATMLTMTTVQKWIVWVLALAVFVLVDDCAAQEVGGRRFRTVRGRPATVDEIDPKAAAGLIAALDQPIDNGDMMEEDLFMVRGFSRISFALM
jgi:hypothetical protein